MSRYQYFCAVCNGNVSKVPVGTGQGKKAIKAGLHGWSCQGACAAKGVKVKRVLSGN